MTGKILDDVKDLLKHKKGDLKALERIKRAAEQNEVISIYERQYVASLVEQFLLKSNTVYETKTIPSESKVKNLISNETKPEKPLEKKIPTKPKSIFGSKKLIFSIGIIVVAILITGLNFGFDTTPSVKLTLRADSSVYMLGDIISISGNAKIGNNVTLLITNDSNQTIWQEVVLSKSDGQYSTLSIAGGQGWNSAGNYTLQATQGIITKEITFNFAQ